MYYHGDEEVRPQPSPFRPQATSTPQPGVQPILYPPYGYGRPSDDHTGNAKRGAEGKKGNFEDIRPKDSQPATTKEPQTLKSASEAILPFTPDDEAVGVPESKRSLYASLMIKTQRRLRFYILVSEILLGVSFVFVAMGCGLLYAFGREEREGFLCKSGIGKTKAGTGSGLFFLTLGVGVFAVSLANLISACFVQKRTKEVRVKPRQTEKYFPQRESYPTWPNFLSHERRRELETRQPKSISTVVSSKADSPLKSEDSKRSPADEGGARVTFGSEHSGWHQKSKKPDVFPKSILREPKTKPVAAAPVEAPNSFPSSTVPSNQPQASPPQTPDDATPPAPWTPAPVSPQQVLPSSLPPPPSAKDPGKESPVTSQDPWTHGNAAGDGSFLPADQTAKSNEMTAPATGMDLSLQPHSPAPFPPSAPPIPPLESTPTAPAALQEGFQPAATARLQIEATATDGSIHPTAPPLPPSPPSPDPPANEQPPAYQWNQEQQQGRPNVQKGNW